jgi:hypothetical protein
LDRQGDAAAPSLLPASLRPACRGRRGYKDASKREPSPAAVLAGVKVQCSQILAMLDALTRACALLRVAARFP